MDFVPTFYIFKPYKIFSSSLMIGETPTSADGNLVRVENLQPLHLPLEQILQFQSLQYFL